MAAHAPDAAMTAVSATIGFPDEIISNVLLLCSTPTFIQLIRSSKEFFNCALQSRKVLLHHLNQIPGDKSNLDDPLRNNASLLLMLRQRAANNLYGSNFTANMTEHLARFSDLDPAASSICGLDADYVRIALVHKHNTDIRQYTGHCAIKEKIRQPPGVKVLKLVQWGRFISVLCAWENNDEDYFPDASEGENSDSETEVLIKTPFPPSANARLRSQRGDQKDSKIGHKRRPGLGLYNKYNYRVCHYDVYTLDDSQTFTIEGHLDFVPRDFAVHNCLQCAILWDVDSPSGRPTEDATVIYYTATESQEFFAAKYEQRTIWPKSGKPDRRDSDSDEEDSPEYLPERIEFFKEGRRIKMYDAGGVVPYQIFSTATTSHEPYSSTNAISFDDVSFNIDTPFYGIHATYRDEDAQQNFCFQTHLCLGVATVDLSDNQDDEQEVRVLCILRSQTRFYPDSCEHRISLQRMAHVSAGNSTVVARLWGWEEMHTNLTGKEAVAISAGGTRIAIAMWDKVLIYALNPRVLCEEVVVDSSDDESTKSKKKRKKSRKRWETMATGYYSRKKDKNLLDWKIAELRPIILDLEGAIAHKMNWSAPKGIITDTADIVTEDVATTKQPTTESEAVTAAVSDSGMNEPNISTSTAVPSDTLATSNIQAESAPLETSDFQQPESQPDTVQIDEFEALASLSDMSFPSMSESFSVEFSTLKNVESVVASSLNHGDETTQASSETTTEQPQDQEPTPVPSPSTPATLDAPADTSTTLHPPVSLHTLNTPLPQTPYGSALSTVSSQASKPSPSARKKDKQVETEPVPTSILKQKSNVELSSPFSTETVKQTLQLKPKVTFSETLPTIQAPLSPPVDIVPKEEQTPTATMPNPNATALVDSSSATASDAAPPQADTSDPDTKKDDQPEVDDLSKIAEREVSASMSQEPAKANIDEEYETFVRRRKRITEDELVILTDRGIQVWNVGAKAKGIRKKKNIPMEERLNGKLPQSKQKGVESQILELVEE